VSNEDLEEDHVGNTLTIPRGMIMTMRELRLTTHTVRAPRAKKQKAAVVAEAAE
jgi:hypothetical protein